MVRTLPMGGYDLVLGVNWLGSLGQVTFDYKKLLKFNYQGGYSKGMVVMISL